MDLHDISRDRGSLKSALERIARVPVITLSISSDALYPPYQQKELKEAVIGAGGECDYHIVDSPDGHDGFLLAVKEIGVHLESFLSKISTG
jgi:homoserine O-acetyltransferase